ncbi:MAG TPA: hypothetical protein VIX89_16290 [Bryobacteraceae bacterium]
MKKMRRRTKVDQGFWRVLCIIPSFWALLAPVHAADLAVTGVLSSSPVSPGGTAQITLTLPSPVALVTGSLSLDLDAAVFDNISAINVFSASGDQVGIANIQGRHADVQFTSDSGGIGRLPSHPVLEVTVPVLAAAKLGTTGAVMGKSKTSWRDIVGNTYTMSFQSPGVSISDGISIQSAVPGGGPLPAGALVRINGQGFTLSTKLQIDDVAWSNPQFVNSGQLTFTLSGPADLTGKLILLTGANGAQATYYSTLTPTSVRRSASIPATVQPIFSQVPYSDASLFYPLGLENASLSPVDVVLATYSLPSGPHQPMPPPNTKKITIEAGAVYILDHDDIPSGNSASTMQSSAPLRKILLRSSSAAEFSASVLNVLPNYDPIIFNWRAGDPLPPPASVNVPYSAATHSTITASTDDDRAWLSASLPDLPISPRITVSVNPVGLSLGSHKGILTIASPGAMAASLQLTVILNVNPYPAIAIDSSRVFFTWNLTGTLTVTSDAAVPITASAQDDWLSVSPASATTPANLTISVTNPSLVAGQTGYKPGMVTIQGPGNTLQAPVYVGFYDCEIVCPAQVTLSAGSGTTDLITRRIDVGPTVQPVTFDFITSSGGPWLSASNGSGGFSVAVNPSGLAAGTYHGAVTIHPAPGIKSDSFPVSVTFIVWDKPAPSPKVFPSSLNFTVPARVDSSQVLSLSTGSLPLEFAVEYQTDDNAVHWLYVVHPLSFFGQPAYTPTGIEVHTYVNFPGEYHGHVTITSPPGSGHTVNVPVTLRATPAPTLTGVPPLIASIVNGASFLAGPIAPGEIVTLFGIFGPNATSGVNIGPNGKVNTASYGNRILFNGVAAPLIYMSPTQINAVAPYEIVGSSTVTIELDMAGIHSSAWTIPVAPSSPGLFTQSGSGQGSGAILNQDNSLNTPSNPAARGSIVQLFATGEGQTTPAGSTGEITQLNVKSPLLPVTVEIGGFDAKVISATTAPKAIAGLFQVNALIPSILPPGPAVVVVGVGSASSQVAGTVSVR